ncbi:MAG: MoaD/ThiS family protein [Clostridia bacterium]
MINFIGHGMFKEYGRQMEYSSPATLEYLLRHFNIPVILYENLIVVMDSKVLPLDYIVSDGDTIHLFLAVMGG